MALLASILEPFSFQLMRHGGAALGWLYFLLTRSEFGIQHREGLNSWKKGARFLGAVAQEQKASWCPPSVVCPLS